MPGARRILIVDDHSTFRLGMTALLHSVPGLQVVGEAATGTQAVRAADVLRPDVVVMDLNMPGLSGIEATRQIVRAHDGVGVLVLSMFGEGENVLAAMRAGARGYILKTAQQEEIVRAIHAVGEGEIIFGKPVVPGLQAFFAAAAELSGNGPAQLTAREREVLALIAQGEGNAAIARILVVSPKTVRNHVTSIFRKLEVDSREQAVMRAYEAGLR